MAQTLIPTITIPGRSGHAGLRAPHWRDGGAVNAIDKTRIIQDALARLEADWRERPDNRHPYLSPGDIIPVTIESRGKWLGPFEDEEQTVYVASSAEERASWPRIIWTWHCRRCDTFRYNRRWRSHGAPGR